MKRFGPFRVGRRMLIVPPWKRENSAAEPPSSSTRAGFRHRPPSHDGRRSARDRIADRRARAEVDPRCRHRLGSTSAIAAALLGKRDRLEREIIAIDTNPTALENAGVNARLNGVEKSIRFSSVPLASIHRHFDLIAANILSHTLIELAPHLKRLVAPGGRLILGGFLADEPAKCWLIIGRRCDVSAAMRIADGRRP